MDKAGLKSIKWGLIDYAAAWRLQKELAGKVAAGSTDSLVFCEHPPTVTLGRAFHERNLLLPRAELAGKGIAVLPVDRGGDVTLHAPGQLIIYPIINLKRAGLGLRDYLRNLEQVAVDFLRDFDIVAQGDDQRRGVWVSGRKIASIGIGVSRWVTYHGMGLNITTDLDLFRFIRPCGLDVQMTSLESLMKGAGPSQAEAQELFEEHFYRVFGCSQ